MFLEVGLPDRALAGLDPILGLDQHQLAGLDQGGERRGELLADLGTTQLEVLDQKVRQRLLVGAHAQVAPLADVARQLARQEHQRHDARLELTERVTLLLQLSDELVDLARQHAGLKQVRGELNVEEIRRDHGAERGLSARPNGLVDHAELVAELDRGAAHVHRSQRVLPEASAHREQGVVGDEHVGVLGPGTDGGAGQVLADLAVVLLQHGLDRIHAVGLLEQHDLAYHGVDVGVGELDLDGEPALELEQLRITPHACLAGAYHKQRGAKPLAALLGGLLDHLCAIGAVADELLDLVDGEQGAGELRIPRGDRLANAVDHLLVGHVVPVGEGGQQQVPDLLDRGLPLGEVVRDGLVDHRRHQEVVDLLVPAHAGRLDRLAYLAQAVVVAQPHHEGGQVMTLGQARRAVHDGQDAEPDAAGAGAQRAGRSVEPAAALARDGQLLEQGLDLRGLVGDAPRLRAVGELVVGPQCPEHLDDVGLAAAKEPADPDPRLLGLAQVAQVGLQHLAQACLVLALADERLELVQQRAQLGLGTAALDLGHAVVE